MKADTLKYINANGSDDIGPYNLQLNGNNIQLFCLDDFRNVTPGESWTVSVFTGDHFYTTGQIERDAVLNGGGFTDLGITCYVPA